MTDYDAREARAALADIDLRTRQAVAADVPAPWLHIALSAVWMIAIGFLTDRPSAAGMPAALVVAALFVGGSLIVNHRRPVKSRPRYWGAARWSATVIYVVLGGALWRLAYGLLEPHTALPRTLAGVAVTAYLVVAAYVLNRWLGRRA
ncbi:hypothetical protein [Actinoplanes sp. NPDC049681]|uniref:hypothetical protein n=1 Tax=Actinoplanes sp. NPDC049681 TaxID=3363905 RepID=UPI003797E178